MSIKKTKVTFYENWFLLCLFMLLKSWLVVLVIHKAINVKAET